MVYDYEQCVASRKEANFCNEMQTRKNITKTLYVIHIAGQYLNTLYFNTFTVFKYILQLVFNHCI